MKLRTDTLKPSPENDQLYRPIDPTDPDVLALADSIRAHGVKEPLVVTLDGYVLSGHRRLAAAKLAGLDTVPCRVEPIHRDDDPDEFVCLLREYNRQRVKSFDELMREEAVSINPEDAYAHLVESRRENPDMSGFQTLAGVRSLDPRRRYRISDAKRPMLEAVLRVLDERSDYWPLSDRSIHYALLNDPPLRHARKPSSRYQNDLASYKDLCDLLTRARLIGRVPFRAIGDDTRPVTTWRCYANVQTFIRRQLDGFMCGYWRDYQRTQPCHVELVAEKLTVQSILSPVAADFCIPLTIGRGYCSIGPRHELVERFYRSGKTHLVVLIVSDLDPEGEDIAESFTRSLRDDFGVETVSAFKPAITPAQVAELGLPPRMKAKRGSSRYRRYVDRHGEDVYELEALAPAELQRIVRDAVESVLDQEALDREREAEREDAADLEDAAYRVRCALGGDLESEP